MRWTLGAIDIFANYLLIFVFITALLFGNINKDGKNENSRDNEKDLPKIEIPKGASQALPGGKPKKALSLSARKSGEAIQYFIDEKPIKYEDLHATLKSKRISRVKIRFDRQISYGHYVSILDLCKQAGITDIINVYSTNN